MIELTTYSARERPDRFDIEAFVRALPPSPGIRLVALITHSGRRVDRPAEGCPASFSVTFTDVLRSEVPVFIEVTECPAAEGKPITTPSRPLFGELGSEPPPRLCLPDDPTIVTPEAAACSNAQSALIAQRAEVIRLCGEASDLKSQRDARAAAAVSLTLLAAGLFSAGVALLGSFWGSIVGAILIGLAAGALYAAGVAAGLAIRFENQLQAKRREVRAAQARYGELAVAVQEACCMDRITVDLEPPSCSA